MAVEDPQAIVRALYGAMVARRRVIERASAYYDGAHNLAFASEKFLSSFGGLFRAFADNWCEVVVDAVEERLNVVGFRVGDRDEAPDGDAWGIWQANEMDAQSQMAHQESLITGASYAVVWYGDDEEPEITVESAMNTIVSCHPKQHRRRMSALRVWLDDDAYEHAELFLPDDVYRLRSQSKRKGDLVAPERSSWIVDPDAGNEVDVNGRMTNPLGVVPVIELRNRQRLYTSRRVGWGAHSEIRAVMPLQDAVNKLMADMMVNSEFAAYAQRFATGYELQEDAQTGQVIAPSFKQGPGTVWAAESPDTTFGQFQAADLGGFVTAIGMVIQHVASISRTPPHYLNASADRLSGESIKAAETGLVAKTKRKMIGLGEGWEETIRIAGTIAKVPQLANADRAETIWADPESRTEAQHVDACLKKAQLGVPLRQIWEDLGYSPQQIARFNSMRATDVLLGTEPEPEPLPEV